MPKYPGEELGLPQVPRKAIVGAVVVIAVVAVLAGALGTVGAGQRGVLLRFQAPTGEIKEEGLYYNASRHFDEPGARDAAREILTSLPSANPQWHSN